MTDRFEFDLTTEEKALLTKHQLAVFAGRIIINARPPITPKERQEIESHIKGEIPADLLRLWETCYGGNLDYDLSIEYPSGRHPFSFAQLFYTDSDDYNTLIGWIEHEQERAFEAYKEQGKEWDEKLSFIPFGGFEYLERVYAITSPVTEVGKILVWSQGLPPAWVGCLTEDSEAMVANSVSELFQLLSLEEDPFRTPGKDDFGQGLEVMEALEPLKADGAAGENLANRLEALLRSAYFDWEESLKKGTLFGNAAGENTALESALATDDVELLKKLHAGNVDFSKRRRGGMNALDMAAQQSSTTCFNWLLGKDISPERVIEFGAASLNLEQVESLLRAQAPIPYKALAFAAWQAKYMDAFEQLCLVFCEQKPKMRRKLATELKSSGDGKLDYAKKMRAGRATSYRTAEETEAHGHALLKLSESLKLDDGNWLSRLFNGDLRR